MNPVINIHNYEEFFLLYVDGELSAGERQSVDDFLLQHPHLRAELEMLQQAVLAPEEIPFTERELLFRSGGDEINAENAETHFLLYVDNELDAPARANVETFVLQHPSHQESFLQLKQTRLQPETVVFPDKASLYRKEKERRVVYLTWSRIAVAAALIGLAVLVWWMVPGNQAVTGGPVTAMAGSQPEVAPVPDQSAGLPLQPTVAASATVNNRPVHPGTAGRGREQVAAPVLTARETAQSTIPDNIAEQAHVVENVTAQAHSTRNEPPVTNSGGAVQEAVKETPPVQQAQTRLAVTGDVPAQQQTETMIQTKNNQAEGAMAMTAQPAVYRELDTEEGDDRKSLYVGSIEINKDKLRGFFRKASSLFRGKAKEEEKTDNTPSHSRSLR